MRKKKRGAEEETKLDPYAWMFTFGDMLQILLTFFVLLLSMSSLDDKAVKEMFSLFIGAVGPLYFGEKTVVLSEEVPPITIPKTVEVQALANLLTINREVMSSEYKQALSYAEALFGKGVTVEKRGKDLAVIFPESMSFREGGVEILPEMAKTLLRIGNVMKYSKNQIHVEGHTDNVPVPSGSRYPNNWDLSGARAVNVMRFFHDQSGISFDRMFAYGYSRYRPVATNLTESGRTRNRRIEIVVRQFESFEQS
jgi:chemotaxis protein MotB